MERVRIEHFKNEKVLCVDFRDLKKIEPIIKIIEELNSVIRDYPPKTLRSLINLEGMFFNNKVKDLFVKTAKENKEYVIAGAVIGASSMHLVMMNAINLLTGRQYNSFFDEESAKEWLIKQT